MTNKLGFIVAGAVLLLLVAGGGTVLALTSGGDPTTVREVADRAVEAAEDLDVEAGIDLLCAPPSAEQRKEVDSLISNAQEKTDDDAPEADYEISEIDGDREGSFRVTITSSESELAESRIDARVMVKRDGDRSCISDVEPVS